jgi:hypothetical protein
MSLFKFSQKQSMAKNIPKTLVRPYSADLSYLGILLAQSRSPSRTYNENFQPADLQTLGEQNIKIRKVNKNLAPFCSKW